MDPASATVVFVGFAASLGTLAELLIQSAQTIEDLCRKFRRAPNDLKRFCAALKRLELLLGLLKDRTSHYAEGDLRKTSCVFGTTMPPRWRKIIRSYRRLFASFNTALTCTLFRKNPLQQDSVCSSAPRRDSRVWQVLVGPCGEIQPCSLHDQRVLKPKITC